MCVCAWVCVCVCDSDSDSDSDNGVVYSIPKKMHVQREDSDWPVDFEVTCFRQTQIYEER